MWKDKKRELKKFEPFRVGGVSHAVQEQEQEHVLSFGQILGTQGEESDQKVKL